MNIVVFFLVSRPALHMAVESQLMHMKKALISLAAAALATGAMSPAASAQSSLNSLSSSPAMGELSSAIGKALESSPHNGTPAPAPAPSESAKEEWREISVPGFGTRSYLVQVPKNFDPQRSYDVIFGFGGMGNDVAFTKSYMNLAEESDGSAIIVYPRAKVGHNGQLAWEGPKYASTRRGEDVAMVKAITTELKRDYRIHSVYGTGLSNGGGMALSVACQEPTLFDAITVVASANYQPIFENCHGAVDTLFIHGTRDATAPYGGPAIGSNGHGGRYLSAQAAFRTVGERNGCIDVNHPRQGFGAGYDPYIFDGCAGYTELDRVNDGEHTWFPFNPSATERVLDFFREH